MPEEPSSNHSFTGSRGAVEASPNAVDAILTTSVGSANEAVSVEDFAQKMLLSRSQLHRKLRALTDKSPTDFVRDYRLDRAHAMLKNREGRVGEVALRVGFGNEKYFSTVFREKFGVSPSQI